MDDSLPSGPSGFSLLLSRPSCCRRDGLVAYRAAVEACSDSLCWWWCTDGSGHAISPGPTLAVSDVEAIVVELATEGYWAVLARL